MLTSKGLLKKSGTKKLILLLLLIIIGLSVTYLSPIYISNCEVGADSPEGLFFDGFYIYDGPNEETSGPYPYRIEYLAPWSELPSILAHSISGDLCEYWSRKAQITN